MHKSIATEITVFGVTYPAYEQSHVSLCEDSGDIVNDYLYYVKQCTVLVTEIGNSYDYFSCIVTKKFLSLADFKASTQLGPPEFNIRFTIEAKDLDTTIEEMINEIM
jgi:hypothetical protein